MASLKLEYTKAKSPARQHHQKKHPFLLKLQLPRPHPHPLIDTKGLRRLVCLAPPYGKKLDPLIDSIWNNAETTMQRRGQCFIPRNKLHVPVMSMFIPHGT